MQKMAILIIAVMFISVGFLSGCDEQTSEEGAAPVINSFTITPSSISFGSSAILNWSVTGATNVSIDNGVGNVSLNGSYTSTPIENQTYTLTAVNSYGNTSAFVIVTVSPAPTVNMIATASGTNCSITVVSPVQTDIFWTEVSLFLSNHTVNTELIYPTYTHNNTVSAGDLLQIIGLANGTQYSLIILIMDYYQTGIILGEVTWVQ